jgi:hypothetical protein
MNDARTERATATFARESAAGDGFSRRPHCVSVVHTFGGELTGV